MDTVMLSPNLTMLRVHGWQVYVWRDGDAVTVIDTGAPGSGAEILAAVPRIDRIVLTHGHVDHCGSAAELQDATGATVFAGTGDAVPIRNGTAMPPPVFEDWEIPIHQRVSVGLPEAAPPVSVLRDLHDGELLDFRDRRRYRRLRPRRADHDGRWSSHSRNCCHTDRMTPARDPIEPDTKDWTWVLSRPCAECGFAPDSVHHTEVADHIRDVHRIFDHRVRLMLDEDEPRFPNWDQDETALADDYASQDPATVATELFDAAGIVADTYARVPPDAWSRRGLRSNRSEFTIASIAIYHLHDIVPHAHDVDHG